MWQDGSGEIDFKEFKTIMGISAGVDGSKAANKPTAAQASASAVAANPVGSCKMDLCGGAIILDLGAK